MTDTFTEAQVIAEMNRIRDDEKSLNDRYQYNTPVAFKNIFKPKPDEIYRNAALQSLRAKQLRVQDEARHAVLDDRMWHDRIAYHAKKYATEQAAAEQAAAEQAGKKGGYRKSRRSRTLKRVQKRKQTRRHRHRHRHRR
jgi:hypothetical protein